MTKTHRTASLSEAGPEDLPEDIAVGRSAALATAGTALSRITGFLRLAALVWSLGVAESRLADSYDIANQTPNIVYELVLGGTLSAVVLRIYVEIRERDGSEEALRFVTRLTNLVLLALAAITIVGMVAAPAIVGLYTVRVPTEEREAMRSLASILLVFFIPQILFYGLNTIATGFLRAHRRIGVVMFAPALNNLIVTATFVAFALIVRRSDRTEEALPFAGILVLGLGTTAGVVALGLVPWVYSRRVGRHRTPKAGLRDPRFKAVARLAGYTVAYAGVSQAGLFVVIQLAAEVRGGPAARSTAFTLFQLPHGLLAVSISFVLGTYLTERAVAGDTSGFAGHLITGLRGIAFFVLPASAAYLAIGPEIVRLLFEHGLVTGTSTDLIAALLRGYALGLVFFSWWHLLLGAFQALRDTRTPTLIHLAAVAMQILLAITAFSFLDDPVAKMQALGLAHAVSYLVAAVTGMTILYRRLGRPSVGALAGSLMRTALASGAVGATALGVARYIERAAGVQALGGQLLQILGATGAGLLLYASLAKILRLEELGWLRRIFSRRTV